MIGLEHLAAQHGELIEEGDEGEHPQIRRRGRPVLPQQDADHPLRVEEQEVAGHNLAPQELDRAEAEELDELRRGVEILHQGGKERPRIDDRRHQERDAVGAEIEPDRGRIAEHVDDVDVEVGDELQRQPDQAEQEAPPHQVGRQIGLESQRDLPPRLRPRIAGEERGAGEIADHQAPVAPAEPGQPQRHGGDGDAARDLGSHQVADRQLALEEGPRDLRQAVQQHPEGQHPEGGGELRRQPRENGRRADQRQGDQGAEDGGDRQHGAVGAALVAH